MKHPSFRKKVLTVLVVGTGVAVSSLLARSAEAQSVSGADPYNNLTIETSEVRIVNPSADEALNDEVSDSIRRRVSLFPGVRYSQQRVDFLLAQTRRIPEVESIDYEIGFGRHGGLHLRILVTLAKPAEEGKGRGMLVTGKAGDFPILYDQKGSFLRLKVDPFALYYSNDNAWFGRPDLMLAGNPLVEGTPAGEGYTDWLEAYVHYGLYGITPIHAKLYIYGGVSGITTGSSGQELFSDETREYTGIEDAYLGIIGGRTSEAGNRFSYNLSVGRLRFTLADGFLIANTAASGQERAALQANARWASDLLVLAQFRYNNTKLELFYVDPDELPLVDSESAFVGVNLELQPAAGLDVGASFLYAPESSFNYFGPTGTPVGTRDGLEVYDARVTYTPRPANQSGPILGGEYAVQRNDHFDMDARAGWVKLGYTFPQSAWSPEITYRLSFFSGDDPSTATFERWDPLLSGGTGEQWVQGANHFKSVQNTNVIAHKIQSRLRPTRKVELVPQLWAFFADSETNIGGNPALSFLEGDEYGYEANVTVKRFVSRHTYLHGHIAYTIPGDATDSALEGTAKNWLSLMAFVRYSF